jgi:hypothetical protein
MKLDERLVLFNSEDSCVPLVPILDVDQKDFSAFLQSAAASVPGFAEIIRRFPKELLLKHVFHASFSGYWPERALAWLSADEGLQSRFREELEAFVGNKVMPQGARQKAKRIVQSLRV